MDRRKFLTGASSLIGASVIGSTAQAEGISMRSPYAVVLESVIGRPKWDPKTTVPGISLILPTEAPGNTGPYDVTAYLQFSRDNGQSWDYVPAKPDGYVTPYRAKSNGGVVEYVLIRESSSVVNLFIPHEVMYLKTGLVTL